ncbi:MAG: nucleotidyltransferase [Spirochaetes bacterium]|nr:MAG: nucleotidyltransferase [Spirochaetota bacterium]RKX95835.1 MAG: nucleotidyltransferase [Spirochaetota bacterium]
MKNDIRWIQRLDNYSKALDRLENAVNLADQRPLSELEQQGLIQSFEYTHELAWKTLKDFLEEKGNKEIYGSRDAVRIAFQYGLIENGDVWMDMIKSRNLSSHTYNEETAEYIANAVLSDYFPEFKKIQEELVTQKQKEE